MTTTTMVTTPATRAGRRRDREMAPRHRGDVEGLRAVAVLLVVAFHAGVPFVSGGFVGVDVFFVLSGFLITGLLLDELRRSGTVSLVGFYARRVRRLLPLSALTLAATSVATFLLASPVDRSGIGRDVVSAALGVANWHFGLESTQYMADTAKSPVLHYWSLGVEEQFYVVWPLLLWVAGRRGLALRRWDVVARRAVVALAALAAVSFLVSWRAGGDSSFGYYGLHTRAWELAAGGLVALGRPLLGRLGRRAADVAGVVGLGLVLVSAVVLDSSTPFPGTAAALPVVGTALLVIAGARSYRGAVPTVLQVPALRYVGRVSYAWYLWHWPVLVLAATRWGEVPAGGDATTAAPRLGVVGTALAVAVSFGLAALSHALVEQPTRTAAWLTVSARRTLRVGAGLVATSLVAAVSLALPSAGTSDTVATGHGLAVPGATGGASAGSSSASDSRPAGTAVKPMTPTEARSDVPPPGGSCYTVYTLATPPPSATCRFGVAHGSRTIALVGDSHAAQWFPAFRDAATANGWTLYYFAKSQCAIADVPVYSPVQKGRYTSCETWRQGVFDRLAAIDGLDAVFVGRWKSYVTDVVDSSGRRAAPATIPGLWQQGMERTMRSLPDVPRVLVLRDTPRPLFDVPSCLSSHLDHPDRCSFPKDGHIGLDDALVGAERAAGQAVGSGRLGVLDLDDLVCPGSTCQVVTDDGTVLFRDAHHLTATFSARLAPEVAPRLAAALPSDH